MPTDEQQIRELHATWLRASKAGDTAAVLSLMTDDALFLMPGQAPFGKQVFAAASQGQQNAGMEIDGDSEVLEIHIAGDWACMLTRLTVTVSRPGAAPVVRSGHTMTVLTRRAGRWLLHRDANLLAPVLPETAA
jgi:uncharacterized protein (TIGR02246 family)